MNQTKRLLGSIRIASSLFSTQFSRTHLPYNQVTTRFLISNAPVTSSPFLNLQGKLFFSSKPEQTLDLIVSQKWSEKLEKELSESELELTHETVVFVLRRLSKEPEKASHFFNWVTQKRGFQPSSAIYNLMLRVYGNKESRHKFWVTAKKMRKEGFFFDDQAYQTILLEFKSLKMTDDERNLTQFYNSMMKENGHVVKKVVDLVMESEWGNGVEERLGQMLLGYKVSDNFVVRVVKDLRKCPLKALSFFKWVSDDLGYEHNTITYNGILRTLGQEDSIGEFWSVLKEMNNVGHHMDIDTYLKISRLFQKRRMLKDTVELYEHMMDSPYKPSAQHCTVLFRSITWSSTPDLDLVLRIVNKFEGVGNYLPKILYDGIHRSLTSLGQFDEAEKIVRRMKDAGYEPDNITYSQLIYGLCKARRLQEASNVIDEMEANGCIPDIKTWTILIQGHCSADEVDKALIFLAKMVEKGCDADADLLDVLVDGFLVQKRISGAYQLLLEMVKTASVTPWQATYKKLIQKLLEERKLEESLDLLRRMKKHNYPPFSEPFIQYVSKFGTVDDALEFLKAVTFKEYPPVSTYQKTFQCFFEEGRQSEAIDLLFKCPPHIREHDSISSLFGSVESLKSSAA